MEEVSTSTDDFPKILMCGSHRAGKTSILKVVFQKMSPHETLFLEPTPRLETTTISRNTLMGFKALDFPNSAPFNDSSDPLLFNENTAVVFVIDAQDEPYTEALSTAKRIIELAHKINSKVTFDILIHKVDGDQFFSDEHKTEILRDINSKLTEELSDKVDAQITFHCTSIYDHTIFDAISKVVQKLIPYVAYLEQSLDLLITSSRMEKAYLFDVVSKIYLASDSQPVDLQSYELCSDMIDVVIDVSCIYGLAADGTSTANSLAGDAKSCCLIHLNNGTLLYLKEVDKCLALVCILREENFDRQHLLDHNIHVFKDALLEIFQASVAGAAGSHGRSVTGPLVGAGSTRAIPA
jgi:Ras-related GTP-binding protein C/D